MVEWGEKRRRKNEKNEEKQQQQKTVSISRGEVVITVFSFGCRQVLMNRRRPALDIVHRPLLELKDACSTDYAMLFWSK